MIKYLGSKRTLLPDILCAASKYSELSSVADIFSGTSRVGHAFKKAGYSVTSNDHNAYAHCLATCYVEADRENIESAAESLISEFNNLCGEAGYFTQTFCERSRFFHPKNGRRVDSIREELERKCLPPILKSVLITSLMEAADRVDSTCGLQMAYLKSWAPRAGKDLLMRMPDVLPAAKHGNGLALCMDAADAAAEVAADIVYLDPPYNQHSYLGNYHIWESLTLWDKPEHYGVACKRVDVRDRKSNYNSKPKHTEEFCVLLRNVSAKLIIVSFSNEGYQKKEDMFSLLSNRGEVTVVTKPYRRYVGAKIGIHNKKGSCVGEVSHTENKEYIYIVDCR